MKVVFSATYQRESYMSMSSPEHEVTITIEEPNLEEMLEYGTRFIKAMGFCIDGRRLELVEEEE